jgi:hypothetical protein
MSGSKMVSVSGKTLKRHEKYPKPKFQKVADSSSEVLASEIINLVGKSSENIQKEIDDKKALLNELGKKERLPESAEKKLNLKKQLLNEQHDLGLLLESHKKYKEELTNVQKQYNKTVDPFNKICQLSTTNKENYHKLAKVYAERVKRIENSKIQHRQKGKKLINNT